MNKVVREISVRVKKDTVKVIGFSSSDRGSKFTNGVVEIEAAGLNKAERKLEVLKAVEKILINQLGPG